MKRKVSAAYCLRNTILAPSESNEHSAFLAPGLVSWQLGRPIVKCRTTLSHVTHKKIRFVSTSVLDEYIV